MSLLAPGYFYASLAVAAAIFALHFIVTRQPRSSVLPTARFVPDIRATTIAPARRPTDLLLMFLRVLTVLAAGMALARPIIQPTRRAEARVVIVDVSRSTADSIGLRDSARASYRDGDALVLFDSVARVIAGNAGDSLARLSPSAARGNLSAALIAALRAAGSVRDRADSLELVIVSPFAKEEIDAATDSIRALWPGRARLATVRSRIADSLAVGSVPQLNTNAQSDDPLAITVALARPQVKSNAFIDRAYSSAATSAGPAVSGQSTATIGSGGALIDWPAVNRPPSAARRVTVDTVGGVWAGNASVIAPFERRWSFPPDSLRGAEVIARWVDGEPAAIERAEATGCRRSVAVPVTAVGDLAIRKDFARFVARLSGPCARVAALVPAEPSVVRRIAGSGGLAPRETFASPANTRSSLAPWLLVLAFLSAIGEMFVRRRVRNSNAYNIADAASREVRAA